MPNLKLSALFLVLACAGCKDDIASLPAHYDAAAVDSTLSVTVAPPWYNVWWVWGCIAILVVGIVVSLFLWWIQARNTRASLRRMQAEKEAQERLNDVNMKFFANLSHEFRTPLTMIAGPVAQLAQSKNLDTDDRAMLDIIRFNTARMLKLINQMLDFNRLENDTLRLQVCPGDVAKGVKTVLAMYLGGIRTRHITLHTEGLEQPLPAVFDADKLDKIVSNVMSNAWRFTPKDGDIFVRLDVAGGWIMIQITNTGSTIPADKLESIFERYNQVDNHYKYGTGIGLYFARELARLHRGDLRAENLNNDTWVRFTLTLPATDVYSDEERIDSTNLNPLVQDVADIEMAKDRDSKADDTADASMPRLLVVDDDPGAVDYLTRLFKKTYQVDAVFSGEDGLKKIEENSYDAIISDVSMPQMDGYEFCAKVKENPQSCHVPVTLLTAKALSQEKIKGIRAGAEGYVTKPFEPEYLMALVASQIENRQNMRTALQQATTTDKVQEKLSKRDKAFMDELYALMEKNLADSELDITGISDAMRVSRSKLFYMVKGLTGETPAAFFKRYKLNRGAELLRTGEYNISEVTYRVGFSSLTLFSRNFKQQFGVTPSEYMKN